MHMFGLTFSFKTEELAEYFGKSHNKAYIEVSNKIKPYGFEWVHGSLYVLDTETDPLAYVCRTINKLNSIDWFKKSVAVVKVFKISDFSDMTEYIKTSH